MITDQSAPIHVKGDIFLGRVEEQWRFSGALLELLDLPVGDGLPYVFLLYGDGGMGKTTLAKRFRAIARDERPFKGRFQILWVDWEDERQRHASLRVGREHVGPEAVFDVLHTVAIREKWGEHFGPYQRMVKQRGETALRTRTRDGTPFPCRCPSRRGKVAEGRKGVGLEQVN